MNTTPIAVLSIDEVQRITRDSYDAGRISGELPAKDWNAKECSAFLGRSVGTVYTAAQNGEIPCRKIGDREKQYLILVCADLEKEVEKNLSTLGINPDDIQDDGTEAQYEGLGVYRRFNIEFSRRRDCIRFSRKIFKSKIEGVLKILAGYSDMPWYEVNDARFSF